MKIGFSAETVNLMTSGPNFIIKQSKGFWTDFFKFIAAAGFRGVELPFNPFSSDPMAFETGRCGIPLSAGAIHAKYGSPEEFLDFLRYAGLDEVTSIHVNANDALLELIAAARPEADYDKLFADMLKEGIAHTRSLKCDTLIVSPTPEIGWIDATFTGDFAARTERILADAIAEAEKQGVRIAIRNEYWSLYRGDAVKGLLDGLPAAFYSPDVAHLMIAEADIPALLTQYMGRLTHVHLDDTFFADTAGNYRRINAEIPVEGPQRVFCDIGYGKADVKGTVELLEKAGYVGWAVAEQRKTTDIYRSLLRLRWYIDHEIGGQTNV